MPISDVQSVKFSNEELRPAADRAVQFYHWAKQTVTDWNDKNLAATITVGGGEIMDGAETDGRTIVTGNDAVVLINQLQAFVTDMEANGGAKLAAYDKYAVNTLAF